MFAHTLHRLLMTSCFLQTCKLVMSDEDHLLEREEVDLLTNNESSEEKDEAATDHKPEMKGSGRRELMTYYYACIIFK